MTGNPVVLLHGFTGSMASTWAPTGLMDLLADAGREVIAVDLPGHGAAELKSHDPADYDGLEAAMLRRLPEGPLDGVGFSAGARILLVMASLEPDRWGRLVVAGVGQNLFEHDEERARRIAAGVAGEAGDDDPVAQAFGRYAGEPGQDAAALAAFMRRTHPSLTNDQLSRVTAPTLVVLGTEDFAGPADPLVEALPHAEHRALRGVDHFATPKDFGFIDATLEFLGAVPRLILVDRALWRWRGRRWAHLVSDDAYDELHRFAQAIGKRRLSFQGDHYDVDDATRALALDAGAVAVDSRELVRRIRAAGLRRRDPWRLLERGSFAHDDVGPRLERLGLHPPMTSAAAEVAALLGGALDVTVLQRTSEVGVGLLGGSGAPAPAQPAIVSVEVHVWTEDDRPLVELLQEY